MWHHQRVHPSTTNYKEYLKLLNRLYLHNLVWVRVRFSQTASRFIKRKLTQTRLYRITIQQFQIFLILIKVIIRFNVISNSWKIPNGVIISRKAYNVVIDIRSVTAIAWLPNLLGDERPIDTTNWLVKLGLKRVFEIFNSWVSYQDASSCQLLGLRWEYNINTCFLTQHYLQLYMAYFCYFSIRDIFRTDLSAEITMENLNNIRYACAG